MESEGEEGTEHETVIITGDYENEIPGTQLTVMHAPQIVGTSSQEATTVATNSPGNKNRYYKQTYRTAWENMPDFKGWLRGVPGEPNRAFCTYCQKTLHAHRLSLLKHTCTLRHQKAAQIHQARKGNKQQANYEIIVQKAGDEGNSLGEIVGQVEEGQEMEEDNLLTGAEDGEENDEDNDEEGEDEEEIIQIETVNRRNMPTYQDQIRVAAQAILTPISTLVIDSSRGCPVHGLQVSLYKLIDGRWTYINEGSTTIEGRCAQFVEASDFSTGRYKLHYDVDRYFEARKQPTMYPFIEVVFDCHNVMDRFHIVLLVSPFGYTTYRGSY